MKKNSIHFNVDDIVLMKVYVEKPLTYKWYEAIPEKRWFFNLFVMREYAPEAWASSEENATYYISDSYYGNHGYEYRFTTEQLKDEGHIYRPENEAGNQWFKASRIYVRLKKTDFTVYFNTNDELNEWLERVKDKAKITFEIAYY